MCRLSGVLIHPQAFPSWMDELLRTYMRYCGKNTEDEWPDSCNVNLYEDGSHAVGWHADDEALFQGLERDVSIVSLHLGLPFSGLLRAPYAGPWANLGSST